MRGQGNEPEAEGRRHHEGRGPRGNVLGKTGADTAPPNADLTQLLVETTPNNEHASECGKYVRGLGLHWNQCGTNVEYVRASSNRP